MLGGIRKIAELLESGQKLTKPRIGVPTIKLLEAPLNIGSKSLVHIKGQLISKCHSGVFKSPKKPMNFFPGFLPYLVSKKRSNRKNKGTLCH